MKYLLTSEKHQVARQQELRPNGFDTNARRNPNRFEGKMSLDNCTAPTVQSTNAELCFTSRCHEPTWPSHG